MRDPQVAAVPSDADPAVAACGTGATCRGGGLDVGPPSQAGSMPTTSSGTCSTTSRSSTGSTGSGWASGSSRRRRAGRRGPPRWSRSTPSTTSSSTCSPVRRSGRWTRSSPWAARCARPGACPIGLPRVQVGGWDVDRTAAAERALVGAAVVPWRPAAGAYIVVERVDPGVGLDDHLAALTSVDGVAGVWTLLGGGGPSTPPRVHRRSDPDRLLPRRAARRGGRGWGPCSGRPMGGAGRHAPAGRAVRCGRPLRVGSPPAVDPAFGSGRVR